MRKQKRPVLKYYGGGWRRAPWIIEHFPPHNLYLEPCFGAGSILFRKPHCKIETINDINGRVVNFFKILRDNKEALLDAISLTPWAEDEYTLSEVVSDNNVEDARRFFFACWGSIGGGPAHGSFRYAKRDARGSSHVSDIANLDHLRLAAVRLKNVQILNRDALQVIKAHIGNRALIYFDPPYLAETRVSKKAYTHEPTVNWHIEAASLLRNHNGPVVVSGYKSALYSEIYEAHGWRVVKRDYSVNGGRRATERLWLSPR
jgi:DNA adenine methylase